MDGFTAHKSALIFLYCCSLSCGHSCRLSKHTGNIWQGGNSPYKRLQMAFLSAWNSLATLLRFNAQCDIFSAEERTATCFGVVDAQKAFETTNRLCTLCHVKNIRRVLSRLLLHRLQGLGVWEVALACSFRPDGTVSVLADTHCPHMVSNHHHNSAADFPQASFASWSNGIIR